jgi:hypothetical protein
MEELTFKQLARLMVNSNIHILETMFINKLQIETWIYADKTG